MYTRRRLRFLTIGNDTWAGGQNQSPYSQFVRLGGATVTLGDRTVVDAGALRLQ